MTKKSHSIVTTDRKHDHDHDQHGLGSKPTRAILLCSWKDTLRHFPLLGGLGKQY